MEIVAAILKPEVWAAFGPLGLVCLALFALLWKLQAEHRDERREMREEANQRTEQMLSVQRETNAALNALTMEISRANERSRRYGDAP